MSSSVPVIEVVGAAKCYALYDKPQHRFLQGLFRGRRQFYREFWALRDVSFSVMRGETVGIIGRNGAGKSTLLQLVCGTLSPTLGEVRVQGRLAALLELGAGFNPEFTGRENVIMYASVLGLSAAQIERKFDDIAAFADIGDFLDQPIKTYSSGMAVRLAFAVVANVDADILVIDEALAVGDAFFVQKCMRFLRRFKEHGTLLFVSHDTGSVLSICDRALWLQRGRLERIGEAKPVVEAYLQAAAEAAAGAAPPAPPAMRAEPAGQSAPAQGATEASAARGSTGAPGLLDANRPSFGVGGATIVDARLCDRTGRIIGFVRGGERVVLQVAARTHSPMNRVLIGFIVKDRLGQALFAETTDRCRTEALDVPADRTVTASFAFTMPLLPAGDYTVCVAVAEGELAVHVQHHYFADALAFRCETDTPRIGLVGIPMDEVRLEVQVPGEVAA